MAGPVEVAVRIAFIGTAMSVMAVLTSILVVVHTLRSPVRNIRALLGLLPDKRAGVGDILQDPKYGTHHNVVVNGVRLHYVLKGSGDKLMLFCHGFPEARQLWVVAFWYAWRHQLEYFSARGYKCVAVDMRGYNESGRPPGVKQYNRLVLLEDIRALIQSLGHRTCTLVAHDWGGVVAWDVVRKYPELFDNLVILNAPHPRLYQKNFSLSQLRKSYYFFVFALPWLPEALMKLNDYAIYAKVIKSTGVTKQDLEIYKYAFSRPGAATAAFNYYRSMVYDMLNPPARELWQKAQVTVRTLVLWGMKDAALGSALINGIEKVVDDVHVVRFDNATHWIVSEEHSAVNSEIHRFLASAPSSRT